MKILYLNNTPLNSEMANLVQVKAMCKAMNEINLDVTLSVPGREANQSCNYGYKVNFRNTVFKNKLDKYVSFFSIIKAIRKVNPDVIFLRDPLMLFYAVFFSKKKIIFESHNSVLHQGIPALNRFYHRLLKRTISTGRVEKLICISHALKNYWINQKIASKKIFALHDGIDEKMFEVNLDKKQARRKKGLPLDKIIVTYSGRLYLNRKIDNILDLAAKFPDLYFLIVGGPTENAEQFRKEAIFRNIENIHFVGQVAHNAIPEYLAASDILLALWSADVPTINYCSPLKLFEYMASKKIILAHAFPTIKEVITHEKNGILVEPENLDDLIIQLDKAVKLMPFSGIGNEAYNDVVLNYTWKKRVKQIFQIE